MKSKLFIFIASFALVLNSCTSDFQKLNTNPNNPQTAPLTNVLGYVIEDIAAKSGRTELANPASFVGHITKGTYTDEANYRAKPNGDIWNGAYGTTLTNVNFIISKAKSDGNNNLLAAAMVLKAYSQQMVVDIYGKSPYTEAGQGANGIIHSKYDNEKDIYYDLLSSLEMANNLFNAADGGIIGVGDLIYRGNIGQWKKFCNSLRLRLAIRISNVDEAKAKAEIATVLNNPSQYPVFESNADNALLTYPGGDWVEPWTSEHSSIGDDFMAKPIIDTLLSYGDPRIGYYAVPLSDGTYSGLEVGQDASIAYSRVNDQFVNNPTGKVFFLKYTEVELIKAESIFKGFLTGDAKTEYEKAITASCKEYGIADGIISTYLSGSKVAWQNDLKQIYVQKWIALFRQTWEAWAEMRRTDVPKLGPSALSASSGHNRTPFRFPYPDSERKLNSTSIPSTVTETDYFWGYQIWWDTRTGVL